MVTTHHRVAATAARASSPGAPGARVGLRELVAMHHEVAATAGRASSTGAPGPEWACTSWRELVTTHHQVATTAMVTTHHQVAATAARAWRPWARVGLRELVTTHHEVAATTSRAASTGAPWARVALRELARDGHHASRGCSDHGAARPRPTHPGPVSLCASWSPRIARLRRRQAARLRRRTLGHPGPPWARVGLRELARDGHHASPGCGDRGPRVFRPAPLGQGGPARAGARWLPRITRLR